MGERVFVLGEVNKSSDLGGVDSYSGGVFSFGGCTHIRGCVLQFRATVQHRRMLCYLCQEFRKLVKSIENIVIAIVKYCIYIGLAQFIHNGNSKCITNEQKCKCSVYLLKQTKKSVKL